ncbi:hypothetical protein BRC81_01795 [Halobacteriales archaeon QS_1_68_20]|nr:MAG: hypothetical protein BRC81_01795 [Halobacteriales archaeon QS_1_68_20]
MIPALECFGYAVFVTVAVQWLGITPTTDAGYGLPYTLVYLTDYGMIGEALPFVVLALAVGLPVVGANLLADGHRRALGPWRSSELAVGWPRHPRAGDRPAGGRADARTTRSRTGPGQEGQSAGSGQRRRERGRPQRSGENPPAGGGGRRRNDDR